MTAPAIPTVEDLPLEQLREWPRNPRRISKSRLEQLKRALVAEPEMLRARPLIALPDGTVVAGNQRLRAARELGWPSLPVVVVDLDEARASEWALRDNRGYGEDDEALVGALLAELAASGRDLDLSGYDSGEVDRLLAAVRPAPVVDPDDAPSLPVEPRSVRGEVYELGPHRVMCGDATSAADVETLMNGERALLMATDPPYLVEYAGGNHPASKSNKGAANKDKDWSSVYHEVDIIDVDAFFAGFLRNAVSLALEPDAAWYVWFAIERLPELRKSWNEVGGLAHQVVTWVKSRPVLTYSHFMQTSEHCQYGWLQGHQPPRGRRPPVTSRNVWEFDQQGNQDSIHPTQKPVALFVGPLTWHLRRGEIVYEPFCGSGTALIAAEQAARRCFAMELEPAFVDVIRQRYADFTGQPKLAP